MIFNIQEKTIEVNGFEMDYIAFGNGITPLVILPGLGDGLQTVKGQSLPLVVFYRKYLKDFRIYIFSRKTNLPKNYTTKEMARDQKDVLEKMQINKFHLMGISQGGMIAQYLAIDYPERIKKLVIAVSTSSPNKYLFERISRWIKLAELNDYSSLLIDTFENTYTYRKLKFYRPLYPLISKIGKPKNFNRFITQANSCLTHDVTNKLIKIECPTLIIGAAKDKIVGYKISEEMAKKIPNSKLVIFEKYGHAVYEECKDFDKEVIKFLADY